MSPVGGSRHYNGRGLGEIGMWGCPACGEDNTGPLAEGCVHCGAGRPAAKAEATTPPPPAPRVSERAPDDPTYDDRLAAQGDVADHWAQRHVNVTIAEAYRAGYLDGVRATRAAQPATPPPPADPEMGGGAALTRTVIAALALFRDQVLVDATEEITSGEWLSVEQVDVLIRRLRLEVAEPETTHA